MFCTYLFGFSLVFFPLIFMLARCFSTVIPQTCKYKGRRFECGLSISCVLAGGKPVDSCSGGMIWSCCVDKDLHQESSSMGLVQNASKYYVKARFILCPILDLIRENSEPSNESVGIWFSPEFAYLLLLLLLKMNGNTTMMIELNRIKAEHFNYVRCELVEISYWTCSNVC